MPYGHVDLARLQHRYDDGEHQPVARLRRQYGNPGHLLSTDAHAHVPQQLGVVDVRVRQLDPDRLAGPCLAVAARVHPGDPVAARRGSTAR
ncbi:hypothetical protein ADL12_12010 [Streptomyces regalis]|uniref:Uncharacterized protein n=1 Tax=Streptomyces regalis TaxID=68262 RepID=A0A0X3V876_9ACTN|nr:hypothetical protein ADL12_12010 [Streptomyces regalis]